MEVGYVVAVVSIIILILKTLIRIIEIRNRPDFLGYGQVFKPTKRKVLISLLPFFLVIVPIAIWMILFLIPPSILPDLSFLDPNLSSNHHHCFCSRVFDLWS
jgi:hypothetical protein